jgi:hypothetical protein
MFIDLARKILVLTAALFISGIVWAQSATTLIGSVKDSQGAAVVSARINIYPQGTSSPIRTQTDAEGIYRAVLPAGGTFVVEVEVAGFRKTSQVVSVANGQESRQDLSLEIAGVAETVLVTASAEAQTVDQISKAVNVVDAEEILNRNTNSSPRTAGIPAANLPAGTVVYDAIPLSPDQVNRLARGETVNYGNATYIPTVDDPDQRRAQQFQAWALKFQHLFSPIASFQASYQKVDTIRIYENGPAGIGFQNPVPNYQFYAGLTDTIDARTNVQFGPWSQLTAGYEFEREGYDDFIDNNNPAARLRSQIRVQQKSNAGYFQDQMNFFGNRLQVSLSGRGQFFRLEGWLLPQAAVVSGLSYQF